MASKILTSLVKRASSSCSSRTPSLLISEEETTGCLGGLKTEWVKFLSDLLEKEFWADARSVLSG